MTIISPNKWTISSYISDDISENFITLKKYKWKKTKLTFVGLLCYAIFSLALIMDTLTGLFVYILLSETHRINLAVFSHLLSWLVTSYLGVTLLCLLAVLVVMGGLFKTCIDKTFGKVVLLGAIVVLVFINLYSAMMLANSMHIDAFTIVMTVIVVLSAILFVGICLINARHIMKSYLLEQDRYTLVRLNDPQYRVAIMPGIKIHMPTTPVCTPSELCGLRREVIVYSKGDNDRPNNEDIYQGSKHTSHESAGDMYTQL